MRDKLCLDNPELLDEIEDAILLFQKNPDDTRLKNHPLTKRMTGKWSFSITSDIRIVYKWQGKNVARFLAIGTHPQVYTQKRPGTQAN